MDCTPRGAGGVPAKVAGVEFGQIERRNMQEDLGIAREAMTRRQLLGGGASIVLGSTLIAACGASSSSGSGSTVSQTQSSQNYGGGTPKKGGTLTVGMIGLGAAETITPLKAANYPDFARLAALFDNLFRQDANQATVPALAESATPNHDATAWALKLRRGVTFHNGKELDADDVVYTIKSWFGAGNMSPLIGDLIDRNAVKKINKYTVHVGLKFAMVDFLSILTWPNAVVVPNGFTDYAHPIGTGPFKFASFNPGARSVFTANPNYWVTGKPYVDSLVINTTFTSESAKVNALLGGSVNYIASMDPTLAKDNSQNASIKVAYANGAGFFPFYIRTSGGVTEDPRVRLALKLVADRPALVSGALEGYGVPQNDIVGYGLPEYFYPQFKQPHDPELAKALLKQAGKPGLAITLRTSTVNIGMTQAATLYAQQASAAGIKINIEQVPSANYLVPVSGYPFPFAQTGWTPIPSVPAFYKLAYYGKASPWNETKWGYNDPAKLPAIKKALGTVNKSAANAAWHALQEQQFKEGGYLIWSTWPYIDGIAKAVKGIGPAPGGSAMNYDWKEAWLEA